MTAVSVTLIIVGGLLVLAPAVYDCLHEENIVRLLQAKPEVVTTFERTLSTMYAFVCWFTGTAMIVVGVVLASSYQRMPAATRSQESSGTA